jgi:hypothetical protein
MTNDQSATVQEVTCISAAVVETCTHIRCKKQMTPNSCCPSCNDVAFTALSSWHAFSGESTRYVCSYVHQRIHNDLDRFVLVSCLRLGRRIKTSKTFSFLQATQVKKSSSSLLGSSAIHSFKQYLHIGCPSWHISLLSPHSA